MVGYTLGNHTLSRAIRGSLILAALLATAGSWAATYRWVDEKGAVHYGDSIPPQYAGQGHVELSSQGRVIKRVEPAATSAQALELRKQAAARKEAEARAEQELARHDSALQATYNNPHEIDVARDRALAQEQALLDSLKIMRLHSTAKSDIDYIDEQVRQHTKALDDVRARFDADKARYIELGGGRQ